MNADELAHMFDRLGELAASELGERLEPIELSRMLDRVHPHGRHGYRSISVQQHWHLRW
ncbi:MAG: hypothetical protein ACOC9B_01535 [Chloroflexota bacterium]